MLRVSVQDNTFQATFRGASADTLHIVWLGFDLMSSVRSGENRGRALQHDFVVLSHADYQGTSDWQGTLPKRPDNVPTLALAAWVGHKSNPTPLQAVGGWYPALDD